MIRQSESSHEVLQGFIQFNSVIHSVKNGGSSNANKKCFTDDLMSDTQDRLLRRMNGHVCYSVVCIPKIAVPHIYPSNVCLDSTKQAKASSSIIQEWPNSTKCTLYVVYLSSRQLSQHQTYTE